MIVSDATAKLARNEQAKLTATYLNGLAIALAALGGIAPAIALAQGLTTGRVVALVGATCWAMSAGLHLTARKLLTKLEA